MELVYLTILLALVEYTVMGALVGRARAKYGVKAPATTGHPDFERTNRVHINTLESLITFIPAVWLFGHYVDARWAAGLGLAFVIGRALYAVGYIRAAEKREAGAVISGVVTVVLLLGALVGVGRALL
ncbi:MAG TPA: MAPEG family protein [Gammaproteobacteria bacterium]|jgi:glutathione S-transferase|nr:MAPEG family protein [Gammaproteobacteria bacterium]